MNPNIPYGHMPMQSTRGRHDVPYSQLPHQMRPHPAAYPQYYPQPMGPMMPQYQQYQNWYPYQHHMSPHPASRHNYYSPSQSPYSPHQMPQQHHQQHPSMIVPMSQQQPQHLQSGPRQIHAQAVYPPPHPPSTTSSTSVPQIQTPPSRPVSTASGHNSKKELTPPVTPSAPVLQAIQTPTTDAPVAYEPFFPPVPWLSVQDEPFPPRATPVKRRILRSNLGTEPVTFPEEPEIHELVDTTPDAVRQDEIRTEASLITPTQTPTPLASDAPSDTVSTQPTTPSSIAPAGSENVHVTPTQTKVTKAAVPVVPIVPFIPTSPGVNRTHHTSIILPDLKESEVQPDGSSVNDQVEETSSEEASTLVMPPPPPTSWAALLRNKNTVGTTATVGVVTSTVANGLTVPKSETLGDVLLEIKVNDSPSKLAFLQPRGLVNTGNMCYMNSVLQMLVFCIPFYEFLDKVAQRASHAFKSNTPLIDAMIMFIREYPAIDTATSVEQLRLRLKPEDYERYGDPCIPEYVYNVIKQLPRFRDMRRGHQQDAQEFLGFLLEELHEECVSAMRSGTANSSGTSTPVGSASNISDASVNDNGWMEVGHKQKAAVTRSSGAIVTESPVTNIFGGKLRSELKVSGNKLSVTLEPYQPLQLDIGSPQVHNIIDALKGLTRPESMQGDFQSARGLKTSATKQVFIETLPPVLILHLKRFHYDSDTKRVEKIWKKVGYPLELEMPKEVFPTSVRNKYAAHGGLPKYRLIGVIYHHGKNASGGHYTVDIRRQDGKEWIRVDDTLIRRIRSDDVAEGGSEEDPKVLAAALEHHKQGKTTGNRFEQIDDDDDQHNGSDKNWNQVNGHSRSKSTMSAIVNGALTPHQDSSGQQTPRDRFSIKDNKVAYLLFYERVTVR